MNAHNHPSAAAHIQSTSDTVIGDDSPYDNNPIALGDAAPGTLVIIEAFERVKPKLMALESDKLIANTIDSGNAAQTARGFSKRLADHRSAIDAVIKNFDFESYDNIPNYALALIYTQLRVVAASSPVSLIQGDIDEMTLKREILIADLTVLSKRGLIDGSSLTRLQGTNGFHNIAMDALSLSTVMRDNWSAIQGKTAVTLEELNQIDATCGRLIDALGDKEAGPAGINVANDMRQRAFTLLINAFSEARRALLYVYDGDESIVDGIAPSLYATGRSASKKKVDATAPNASAQPGASNNGPVNALPVNPGPTNTVPVAVPNAPRVADASDKVPPPGMPGNPPFVR